MKNMCTKKANKLGTSLSNIVKYIIVEGLKKQIKFDNINFILNTRKNFGNNNINFEHIENNGFTINVEIYNKKDGIQLIITKSN